MAPSEAWDYFYRHQERMDLLLLAAYTNFTAASDLVPQNLYGLQLNAQRVTLGSWVGVNSSISGAPGSAASAAEGSWRSSLNHASTRGLPGGDPGQPGDQQELGRFVDGWTARRLAHCSWARNASTAVTPPGASTGRAAWDYVVPASPGGSVVGIFLLSAP